jgi:hypothetical protein
MSDPAVKESRAMAQTLHLFDFPPLNFQQSSVMEVSPFITARISNLNCGASSFLARKRRIYLRCAPPWKVAGQHCGHK